jgi:hypothetical protein
MFNEKGRQVDQELVRQALKDPPSIPSSWDYLHQMEEPRGIGFNR